MDRQSIYHNTQARRFPNSVACSMLASEERHSNRATTTLRTVARFESDDWSMRPGRFCEMDDVLTRTARDLGVSC
jgi:hypothetical protein